MEYTRHFQYPQDGARCTCFLCKTSHAFCLQTIRSRVSEAFLMEYASTILSFQLISILINYSRDAFVSLIPVILICASTSICLLVIHELELLRFVIFQNDDDDNVDEGSTDGGCNNSILNYGNSLVILTGRFIWLFICSFLSAVYFYAAVPVQIACTSIVIFVVRAFFPSLRRFCLLDKESSILIHGQRITFYKPRISSPVISVFLSMTLNLIWWFLSVYIFFYFN